jgi:FixJ family two-component response regulator
MNIQQLIDLLTDVEDKSTPVVLITDHGQTPMKLNGSGFGYVEDINKYMMEQVYDEDLEEYHSNCDKVYFLEAF